MTGHGRATPLAWLTVDAAALKDNRNEYEYRVLVRLADMLPGGVKVCIVANRGFGDRKLYRVLTEALHCDYLIHFRGNIKVAATGGEARSALEWMGGNGRTTLLSDARVTAEQYPVGGAARARPGDADHPVPETSYRNATIGFLKSLHGQSAGGSSAAVRDSKDSQLPSGATGCGC